MKFMGLDCHKHYTFATKIAAETGQIIKAKLANTPNELKKQKKP